MSLSKILTKEQSQEVDELFKELSTSTKKLKRLTKPFTAQSSMPWDKSEDVKEANKILHSFLKRSLETNNKDLAIKVTKVINVIDTAALVFWKAATYEILAKKYEKELKKYEQ